MQTKNTESRFAHTAPSAHSAEQGAYAINSAPPQERAAPSDGQKKTKKAVASHARATTTTLRLANTQAPPRQWHDCRLPIITIEERFKLVLGQRACVRGARA